MKRQIDWSHLPPNALIRQRDLLPVLPFAAATLWRRIGSGDFPAPVKLPGHISAWLVCEVLQWLDAQAKGRDAK